MSKENKHDAHSRSKSNLGFRNINPNATLERTGSEPNLLFTDLKNNKLTQYRLAYGRYLSSVAAKYSMQRSEKELTLNINKQKSVFQKEFHNLKQQLVTLSEELKSINELNMEKNTLDSELNVLEKLNKTIVFDDTDEETMLLFTNTAFKVVVKNFKEMDDDELNTVGNLLNDIIEQLKLLNYDSKIEVRDELKGLLIKMAAIIKELDECKTKCEEQFDKIEFLKKYNTSLHILKDQYGENPSSASPPIKSNLMEEVQSIFDEIKIE